MSMPIAISAALHDAMACTVCRWLCTEDVEVLGTVKWSSAGLTTLKPDVAVGHADLTAPLPASALD